MRVFCYAKIHAKIIHLLFTTLNSKEVTHTQAGQHKTNNIEIILTLSQTSPGFYMSVVQAFGKHCGKRRNCS